MGLTGHSRELGIFKFRPISSNYDTYQNRANNGLSINEMCCAMDRFLKQQITIFSPLINNLLPNLTSSLTAPYFLLHRRVIMMRKKLKIYANK